MSRFIALGLFVVFTPTLAAAQVPRTMLFQGDVQRADGSSSLPDTLDIRFQLIEPASGGAVLWSEEHPDVELTGSEFREVLGLSVPIEPALLSGTAELELATRASDDDAYEPLEPTIPIHSVPFALQAASLEGGYVAADFVMPGDLGAGGDVSVDWGQVSNVPVLVENGPDGSDLIARINDGSTVGELDVARMPSADTLIGQLSTGSNELSPSILPAPHDASTYTVFTDGTTTFARDNRTGAIEISDASAFVVLQHVLDALVDGGAVRISDGDYVIDQPLLYQWKLKLSGAEMMNTRLLIAHAGNAFEPNPGNSFNTYVEFENIRVSAATVGQPSHALYLYECKHCVADRVLIEDFGGTGIYIDGGDAGAFYNYLNDVRVFGCGAGVEMVTSGSAKANQNMMVGGWIASNVGRGLYVHDDATNNSVFGTSFEGNGDTQLVIEGTNTGIHNIRAEAGGAVGLQITANADHAYVTAPYLTGNAGVEFDNQGFRTSYDMRLIGEARARRDVIFGADRYMVHTFTPEPNQTNRIVSSIRGGALPWDMRIKRLSVSHQGTGIDMGQIDVTVAAGGAMPGSLTATLGPSDVMVTDTSAPFVFDASSTSLTVRYTSTSFTQASPPDVVTVTLVYGFQE